MKTIVENSGSENVMELNYSLLWDLLGNLRKESVNDNQEVLYATRYCRSGVLRTASRMIQA